MIETGAVLLRVADVETSRLFYEGLLGFRLLSERAGSGLELGIPGLVLLLMPRPQDMRKPETDPFGWMGLALSVADIDARKKEFEAQGVSFEGEVVDLPAGRVAFFRDPDGYTLGLIQRA
mgnify:CR=1 FL=1